MANDLANSFTIEEITGDKRTLVLIERALPYKGVTWVGTQRAKKQWYPGSPVATLQFLGSDEGTTSINGVWKDKFVAQGLNSDFINDIGDVTTNTAQTPMATVNGGALVTVKDLAETVDDIRRKGQLVQVTWLHLTRRGYLKTFSQKWNHAHEVEWSIEFDWIAKNDESDAQIISSLPVSDLVGISNTISNNTSLLSASAVPTIPTQFSFTQAISDKIDSIQTSTNGIASSLNNYIGQVNQSTDSVRRSLGYLQSIISEGKEMYDNVVSQVAKTRLIGANTIPGVAAVTEGQSIAASFSQRQLSIAIKKSRRDAGRAQQTLLKGVNPDLIQSFYARQDQDLRDVSIQFYGTADGWRYLLQFNNLNSSKLNAGQLILVPKRKTNDSVP